MSERLEAGATFYYRGWTFVMIVSSRHGTTTCLIIDDRGEPYVDDLIAFPLGERYRRIT